MHRALVSVAVSCLSVCAALAQESPLEISPFLGYQFGGDLRAEDELGLVRIDFVEDASLGVALDFSLGPNWQVELLVNHQSSAIELDEGIFGLSVTLADVNLTHYQGGLLWQLNVGQVKPYLVLTGGVTEIDPDLPGVDGEFRPSLSFGGGVKLILSDHFGVRLEGRVYAIDVAQENLACCVRDVEETLLRGSVSGGLIFRF